MRDIDKIKEKVEKRKRELEELYQKDKENYDLWMGKEQVFDTHKMAINITGTELVALALKTQASINRHRLDIHVLAPNSNPDAVKTADQEERMYYHGFQRADERLSLIGEPPLLASVNWQAAILGRTAVRVLVFKDNGEIVWDYLPLNPRFLTFSFGANGLMWACYETFRSSECIYNEYKKEVPEIEGKGISVSDYWDGDHNVRYITKTGEVLQSWKHPLGEVPIILQPVARAPKAIDTDGIKVTTWGESIFDHVKTPFKTLNKMRSIAATHAHFLAKRPIEEIYEESVEPNIEEESIDYHPGALIKHPKTIELKPMDIADIPESLVTMMGDLSSGIRAATYTQLNPDTPAHSGSALRILGQEQRDTETPIVSTLNTLYTRICKMAKRQILLLKLTIDVQTVVDGQYQIYDMKPKLLENDFHVSAELIRQDVYDEVEALQRAQLMKQNRFMSTADIMERILNEQDVPSQMGKIDMEDVEAAIPEMKLRRLISQKQREFDDLVERGIQDRNLADEIKMLKQQLAMLAMEKQQTLQQGMPQGAPQQGAGVRPTAQPVNTARR